MIVINELDTFEKKRAYFASQIELWRLDNYKIVYHTDNRVIFDDNVILDISDLDSVRNLLQEVARTQVVVTFDSNDLELISINYEERNKHRRIKVANKFGKNVRYVLTDNYGVVMLGREPVITDTSIQFDFYQTQLSDKIYNYTLKLMGN